MVLEFPLSSLRISIIDRGALYTRVVDSNVRTFLVCRTFRTTSHDYLNINLLTINWLDIVYMWKIIPLAMYAEEVTFWF